jgi:hypothetical protein
MYRCIRWHSNQDISPWKMDKSVVDQPPTHPGSRQMQLFRAFARTIHRKRAVQSRQSRVEGTTGQGRICSRGRHQPRRGEEKSKRNLHGPDLRGRQKTPPDPCPYIRIIGM